MLPRWALAAWSHSCCRFEANLLMLGPACSSHLPANKAGIVLLCLGKKRPQRTGLVHQVVLLALNATHLSWHGLADGGCKLEPVQHWQLCCKVHA